MLKNLTIAFTALFMFMVMPAFADPGCRNGKFVGSYTLGNPSVDLFGDGTVIHSFVYQLNLRSDGTVDQYWTGFPDYFINLGTGSPWIGSWTCRQDGKLVVNVIRATYLPTTPSANAPNPDVQLVNHVRSTYLFSVIDDNTIRRIQARARVYTPAQDPTDATGGTLGTLNMSLVEYKRLVATDADLLAP